MAIPVFDGIQGDKSKDVRSANIKVAPVFGIQRHTGFGHGETTDQHRIQSSRI